MDASPMRINIFLFHGFWSFREVSMFASAERENNWSWTRGRNTNSALIFCDPFTTVFHKQNLWNISLFLWIVG